ncbi:MAG: hypothetical protein CSA55_00445 [Ilumatobacter coccineus]|uniref:Holin-X, holin superfamily III n=1 Tax=Ilumatobacter coccineus TaxID=467094 RepID=A0A2G6KG47_9ACTN|nr:MAG: hypothetical protein CSA55_00445 [Ilumatobacter coccineus]
MSIDTPQASGNDEHASVSDVVDFVKAYAEQETVGPLKSAGRWIAYGSAGAIVLGLGLLLIIVGLLRLIQVEWTTVADPTGKLSWLPYLIVLVVCVIVIKVALGQIPKKFLNKEDK